MRSSFKQNVTDDVFTLVSATDGNEWCIKTLAYLSIMKISLEKKHKEFLKCLFADLENVWKNIIQRWSWVAKQFVGQNNKIKVQFAKPAEKMVDYDWFADLEFVHNLQCLARKYMTPKLR